LVVDAVGFLRDPVARHRGSLDRALSRSRARYGHRPFAASDFAGCTGAQDNYDRFPVRWHDRHRVFLVANVVTGHRLALLASDNALTIRLTGYRWWWKVQYPDATAAREVTTANEIHIPVGRPVLINTYSQDVIHSFWVPPLNGKRDLIPGKPSALWLQADQPGRFEGQCAEFCGLQHAHMRLLVIAEPEEQFEKWLEAQRQPAGAPAGALAERGLRVFETGPCALCHSIRGTQASGQVAPDLTHFASRATIAAGTLPNSPGHLAAWIVDPQHIKPGNAMPANSLSPEDLHGLLAYLGGLQ
jgi:cytochrome c oxidase subunit 2